jgi:hypothetical protein
MIKVYEVLKSLDISYPDKGQTDYSNISTFYLTKGDFFFIEPGYWGRVEVNDLFGQDDISSSFVETNVLKKIVFKGVDDFWEEEDNINLFNPLINKSLNIEDALKKKLIIESVSWKRDDILEELGI